MKKRIIALLLCIVMMVSMFGCAGQAVIPRNLTDNEGEEVSTATPTPTPAAEVEAGIDTASDTGDSDLTKVFLEDTHGAASGPVYLTDYTTGTIKSSSVTLYDHFEDGDYGINYTTLSGTSAAAIEVIAKVTYNDGFVLYFYDYLGDDTNINTVTGHYQYISSADVTLDSDTTLEVTPTPTPVVTPTPAPSTTPEVTPTPTPEVTPAPESGITLDFLPADLVAENESVSGTTAAINSTSIKLYKSLDNGAEGIEVAVESGTQIDLITKYTFTTDDGSLVFYRYEYSGSNTELANAAIGETSGYPFVYAGDITIAGNDSLVETNKTDSATGVAIYANLPENVELSVTAKTLAESGIDTTVYPINGASLFYDVTLYQNDAEYQPTEGITITFPESAITDSGLAVGDYYKIYHIHDGVTDVTGLFQYTGGAIEATFDSLSVVGVASSTNIDLTTVYGAYQSSESYYGYAVINSDSITVYGAVNSENTDYIDYTGVQGIAIELVQKAIYENGNLYYYTYSGEEDLKSYYFIPEEFITITCCADCTGAAGCTCSCTTCVCNTATQQTLTDTTTGIIVSGVLPAGTQLVVTDATSTTIPGLSVSHLQYKTVSYIGYNISLVDADGNPLADDAFDTVTVYVPGVWNTSYSDPIADVYHLNDDGTLNELLTTRNGTVALMEDGAALFRVSGFSDYAIVSGNTDSNISVTQGDHIIYIARGSTGTLTLESTNNVTLSTTNPVSGVTVSSSTSGQSTIFTITATDAAVLNSSGTFTITSKGGMQAEGGPPDKNESGSNQTRTATYTVKVVSADEAVKQQFIANSISHIQINIESSAVVLGYNNDTATTIDLNYDELNETNNLTKVSDDSSVGFHYELTYTVDGVETKVIVRVDETATKLPTGVTYADIAKKWSLTGTTEEDGQISFNGTIPVGTKDNPVVYSVTVESTFNLTPNNGDTAEPVDVSISNNMGYWYSTNECPGLNHNTSAWEAGSVIQGSGIDLSKFTMGSVLGDTTYYVVFSNLTKVVNGYTFGEGESKNYVFTIYRDLLVDDTTTTDKNEADVVEWVAFDTISITAGDTTIDEDGNVIAITSFTTDATKYSVEDIDKYEYKIVETGYSISGYSCSNVIEVKSKDNYVVAADGLFTFSTTTSADEKTVTYSAEIRCTNTYTEAGLTVSKVVNNAPASAANDEFIVRVWPKELSTEGVESGTNMYTYFNTGTYKVGGTPVTVTNSTFTTEYGYIALTLKGGETKTITGLPAGTYYVQEQDGTTNANWTYDLTQYEANLSSGGDTVTITNTYKYADLTITKIIDGAVDANQSFIFDVKDEDGNPVTTVVINGAGSVTIKDLLIDTYTVTEDTNWSWRYSPKPYSQSITLKANSVNELTFENILSEDKWLSGDSFRENQFTVNN